VVSKQFGCCSPRFEVENSFLKSVFSMENTGNDGVLVSKVPMLKPNEFDMWKIRIRQYILLTDYSMWDIIENGPAKEELGTDGKRAPPKD
jgi:hypothetical protein